MCVAKLQYKKISYLKNCTRESVVENLSFLVESSVR